MKKFLFFLTTHEIIFPTYPSRLQLSKFIKETLVKNCGLNALNLINIPGNITKLISLLNEVAFNQTLQLNELQYDAVEFSLVELSMGEFSVG